MNRGTNTQIVFDNIIFLIFKHHQRGLVPALTAPYIGFLIQQIIFKVVLISFLKVPDNLKHHLAHLNYCVSGKTVELNKT